MGSAGLPRHEHTPPPPAFLVQAVLSLGVSTLATGIGLTRADTDGWQRAFLAVGVLFVVTSTLTLAPCVRDQRGDSEDEDLVRTGLRERISPRTS